MSATLNIQAHAMKWCAKFVALLALASLPCYSKAERLAEIHLSVASGLPTTMVTIGGKQVLVLIDLGGFSAVALTVATTADLPITYSGNTLRWRNSDGAEFSARGFSVSDVFLGGKKFGPLQAVELPKAPANLAGYVGVSFLKNFLLVFNYQRGTLSLYEPGDVNAMRQACGNESFPIRFSSGVVQSTVETELGSLVFQWDTGSAINVLRPSSLPPGSLQGAALQSFSKFTLGNIDSKRTVFSLREFAAPSVDGVLGTDFFEANIVCLDIANRVGSVKQH